VQANLNELLRDGKKAAIAEFKESKDKDAFKDAKDLIKETRFAVKEVIIGEKKDTSEMDEERDKDDNRLVKRVKISEQEALTYAFKKFDITTKTQLDDLKNLEIKLEAEKNPAVY